MHTLQPEHAKLNEQELGELLSRLNIAVTQLPKISQKDAGLPEGTESGDVVKISRGNEEYYRVVI